MCASGSNPGWFSFARCETILALHALRIPARHYAWRPIDPMKNKPVRLLSVLLAASIALNLWQFASKTDAHDGTLPPPPLSVVRTLREAARNTEQRQPQASAASAAEPDKMPDTSAGEPLKIDTILQPAPDIAANDIDYLLHGVIDISDGVPQDTTEHVTAERLEELSKAELPKAESYRIAASLLLAGNQRVELGSFDLKSGYKGKFEKIREFPFPTGWDPPQIAEQSLASALTPRGFEFRNTGVDVEVCVTPQGGVLMVTGVARQTYFDGYEQMPGEIFLPIVNASGELLSENHVLQPRFTTREAPFVIATSPGSPCRVPVNMSSGRAFLEMVCVAFP
jgi:hypothetical protein